MSIAVFALLAMSQAAAAKPPVPPQPTVVVPVNEATPAPSAGRPRINATRGIAPASGMAASASPLAPLQSLISMADYPATAISRREQGSPGFRLAVDANGRVAGCVVLVSSGSTALDAATCSIMRRRARFTPARDSSGRPIEDQYFGEVAWRIER